MLHVRYLFLLVFLVNGGAIAENGTLVDNPGQCLIRCKEDACKASSELAASCRTVCKGTTFYKKIVQMCGGRASESPSVSPKASESSEFEKYKAKREAEKAKEFASALSKGQGKRLGDIRIEEVQGLSKHEGLDENNNKLTPKGVFMVLQHVNVISPIKNAEDADKALKIRKGQTGTYSDQLFVVTVDPKYLKSHDLASTYVIKGLKDLGQVSNSKENTPQKELQDLEKVKNFIVPELKGTNVHIATRGGACWYFDMQNKKRYLVVLSAASGKSLEDWANLYLQGSIDKNTWMRIMKSVGKTLGELHYTLATPDFKSNLQKGIFNWESFKTTTHGDLHPGNGFYEQPDQTILIDAASMADSLTEKVSPFKDLADLYLKTKYMLFFNNAKGFGWLNEGFQSFNEGYGSAFPSKSQRVISEALLQKYHEWSQRILHHIRENGFADYSANDVLKQIVPTMLIWFKGDKRSPDQVVKILETDEMAVDHKRTQPFAPLVEESPLNP